uniref:tRNA threonylcarbamoyladenosine dehydratase n=2 Tax=Prevotella sp. TaxID=59823 RepID=UPI0040265ED2
MQNQFSRTQLLLGKPAIDTLNGSRVAVFGVGGVGGYVVEVLARSGVGALDIIDDDRVCLTNVNRQILATISSVGRHKVDVAEERIHDINPRCHVRKYQTFYLPSNSAEFDFSRYDYVVDCIDTVTAKLDLIKRCHELNIPIISCMGAAYKLDATQLQVTDIWKTINDPLAKVIRKKLRKTGIKHLKVVYSPELPIESIDQPDISCRYHCICPAKDMRACTERHTIPSSNAWVPATAGLICGGEVVKDLVNNAHTMRVDLQEDPDNVYAKKAAEKKAAYLDDYKKRVAERKKAKAMADNDNKKGKVLETEDDKEALRDAGADI